MRTNGCERAAGRSLPLLVLLASAFCAGCEDPCDDLDDLNLRSECFKLPFFDCKAREAFVNEHEGTKPPMKAKKPKPPEDRYMVLHPHGSPALGFSRIPLDLWTPFEWHVTYGIYDESKASLLGAGIFGTELDARPFDAPLEFYGIYAQFTNGGLNVFVSSQDGNQGSHFFASARIIDVIVRHDGTDLIFSARVQGDADYVEVARIAMAARTVPLNPGIGAFNVTQGAEIGFDHVRLVENGVSPAPVAADHAAIDALFAVYPSLLETEYALDRDGDADKAGASLSEALTRIADAGTAIAALPAKKKPSPRDVALKDLTKAANKLSKGLELLQKKGIAKADPVRKGLHKAALYVIRAGDEILPQELRDSLPGTNHTLKR